MSDIMNSIDRWLVSQLRKDAAMDSEQTSHPSAQGDNGTQPAREGARASENEADVKSEIIGESVNEASPSDVAGPGRGENNPTTEIGTKAAPTGEDSSSETSSVKDTKEDPGTSHPANTENKSIGDGSKYAELESLGQSILADIAVARAVEKSALATAPAKAEKPVAAEKPAAEASPADAKSKKKEETPAEGEKKSAVQSAAEAAIAAAEAAGAQAAEDVAKQAGLVQGNSDTVLGNIVKSAAADAAALADFLDGFTKGAMEGIDPAALAAMAGEAAPEAVPGAVPGAAPEEAMAEEAVAEEPGAPGGGIEEVAQILAEAGIGPEELLAAVGGAEAAPAAPGTVPAAPEAAPAPVEGEEDKTVEEAAGEEASESEEGESKESSTKKAWDALSADERKAVVERVLSKIGSTKKR